MDLLFDVRDCYIILILAKLPLLYAYHMIVERSTKQRYKVFITANKQI